MDILSISKLEPQHKFHFFNISLFLSYSSLGQSAKIALVILYSMVGLVLITVLQEQQRLMRMHALIVGQGVNGTELLALLHALLVNTLTHHLIFVNVHQL